MFISFIVAAGENNVMGKDNKLPWCLPADMRYFKNVTWAMPVIMGRKTYESLGKPLQGRSNYVITRNKDWKADGVEVAPTIDQAIALANKMDTKEIFIIGGAELFKASMGIANRIYLTRIHADFDGDTFFPVIDQKEWHLAKTQSHPADEKNSYPYSFEVWERNR